MNQDVRFEQTTTAGKGNILAVDDNPNNLRLLIQILNRAGYQVRPATSGELALKAVATKPPDLILLDIRMPDMDGFEVCQRLKAEENHRDIPIIFISALGETMNKVRAFSVGGSDFISKPFETQEVLARVGTQIRQRSMQRALEQQNELLEERVRARTAELAESELKYRHLVENAPAILYRYSTTRGNIYASPQVKNILGITPEQLQKEPELWHDSIHPQDLPRVNAAIREVGHDERFNLDYRIRTNDGRWCWLNDSAISLHHENDETIIDGLAVDITERKRQEQQRQTNEERLQLMLALNNDSVMLSEKAFFDRAVEIAVKVTHSQAGYLHKINPDQNTLSLVSWNRETINNCSADHDSHYPIEKAGLWADSVRQGRIAVHNDYPAIPGKKGYPEGHLPISRHMSVPMLAGGKVRLVLGIGNKETPYDTFDATQLQYVADDVMKFLLRRETKENLQLAKEKAESASRAKSEFLAIMSHELRTPLNAILGMAEIIGETDLDPYQTRCLAIVNRSGRNMLALVEDILNLAQIESGRMSIETVPVPLPELIRDAMAVHVRAAEKKGLVFDHRVKTGTPERFLSDPNRLRQVLINLLGNAIKFTDRGGVELQVSRNAEDTLLFSVADTGIGIPPDKRQMIFEPFCQADTSTTRRHGGAGLGLTLCKRLIDTMGGRIWLESDVGKGSRFHFSIPLALEVPAPDRAAGGQPIEEGAPPEKRAAPPTPEPFCWPRTWRKTPWSSRPICAKPPIGWKSSKTAGKRWKRSNRAVVMI